MLEQHITADYSLGNYTEWNERLIYMDYVNKKYQYKEVAAMPIDAYRFQGNLYGLLKYLGVTQNLLFYTMYINGYNNPLNYDGKKLVFKVPVMPPIPEA